MESVLNEELEKMVYDSRATVFIDKSQAIGKKLQALKIQKVKKGKISYWVIWFRTESGKIKDESSDRYLALTLGESKLNSDFIKTIKASDWFVFNETFRKGLAKAYKFTLIR